MRRLSPLILAAILTACGSSHVETHAQDHTQEDHSAKTHQANVHPSPADLGVAIEQIRALKQVKELGLSDQLPSEQDIEKIISDLPDFNHIMDGMAKIAQDEELQNKLKSGAEHMKKSLEESGALETRENGLPDINGGIAVMLRALSDKDGLGAIVDTLEDVAKEMGDVVEQGLEKSPEPIHGAPSDDADTGLTKI